MQSVSQDVLAKGITVRANKATNSIFIRHYEADLERIKKLIREQLDVPLPQIKIEARMEILDRNVARSHRRPVGWGGRRQRGAIGGKTLIAPGVPGMTCRDAACSSRTGTGVTPNVSPRTNPEPAT